jgi:hypothetical protein
MLRPLSLGSALCCALCLVGCARGGAEDDAGQPGTDASFDAGRADAGRDSGPPPGLDAGTRDAGGGTDAGTGDAGTAPDAGTPDAGMDAGTDAGGGGDCAPSSDNMMITEIMVASQSGSGDLGEWFEVRNLGSCPIDLSGLVIESPTAGGTPVTHTVSGGLLTAGGYFLFAQSGDPAENHGLSPDYAYGSGTSGVVFNNGGDELILSLGGTEIDRVAWGSTDYTPGAARQLTRGFSGDNFGLNGSGWCDATELYSEAGGSSFRGTPGARNTLCP